MVQISGVNRRDHSYIVLSEEVISPVYAHEQRNTIQQPHNLVFPAYIFFAH